MRPPSTARPSLAALGALACTLALARSAGADRVAAPTTVVEAGQVGIGKLEIR